MPSKEAASPSQNQSPQRYWKVSEKCLPFSLYSWLILVGKSAIQAEFVKKDGLEILEKWLKPQPDGPQPSLYLKRKILENLNMFVLEREQFVNTDLGKVVNKICMSQCIAYLLVFSQSFKPNPTMSDDWRRLWSTNGRDFWRIIIYTMADMRMRMMYLLFE